ncbi:MAG: hypothetical protein JNM46_05800 [Anaerolineales bacterium]|nr:hypothetical protein [Anaerolineales bacterium]
MESTPDTSAYMIAGYMVAFLVMGIYILSIYIRNKNLKAELEILEELEEKK